jgi:hypothetical protein
MYRPKISPQMGHRVRDARDRDFRVALGNAIDSSGKDRARIARELTERLHREPPVTVHMLNDFVGLSDEKARKRLPAAWLSDLCAVLENDDLLLRLLPPRLRALVNIGECELQTEAQINKKRKVIASLVSDSGDSKAK